MNRRDALSCTVLAVCALAVISIACGSRGSGGATVASLGDTATGTISGKVVEKLSGALTQASASAAEELRPVQGARVTVGGTNLSTETDADGTFSVVGVPDGTHEVLIERDTDGDGDVDFTRLVRGVPIRGRKGHDLGEVELETPGSISGRATLDGAESGNLGVAVFVPGTSFVAFTDDTGNFTISNVPSGTYSVAAQHTGYQVQQTENVEVVEATDTGGLAFLLPKEVGLRVGAIEGTAFAGGASSHEGITVSLSNSDQTAVTDGAGSYGFSNVPEGIYVLTAAVEGYTSVQVRNVIVLNNSTYSVSAVHLANLAQVLDLDGDGIPNDLDLDDDNDGFGDEAEVAAGSDPKLPHSVPTGVIAGRVELSGQSTHANVLVAIQGSSRVFVTADDGYFTLTQIPVGVYRLGFIKRNFDDVTVPGVSVAANQMTSVDMVTMSSGMGAVAAPTGTVATSDSATASSISLRWSGTSDDATGSDALTYRLYAAPYNFASVSGLTPWTTTAAGVTSYLLEGLNASTLYTIVVQAVDGDGNVESITGANKIAVQTLSSGTVDSAPPAGTVLTVGAPTASSVALSWTPATDDVSLSAALSYRIYAQTTDFTSISGLNAATSVIAGTTNATLGGLSANTQYFVAVLAIDEAGNVEGLSSSNKSAVTTTPSGADTTAPSGTNVALGSASTNSATLVWQAANDDASASSALIYRVYLQSSDFGSISGLSPATSTQPGATSAVINNLSAGATCFAAVLAVDESGNIETIASSNKISITTNSPGADGIAPAGTVLSGGASSTNTIPLSWTSTVDNQTPAALMKYLVYVELNSFSTVQTLSSYTMVSSGGTACTVSGLVPGTQYYIAVLAIDESGNVEALSSKNAIVQSTNALSLTWIREASIGWIKYHAMVKFKGKYWSLGGDDGYSSTPQRANNGIRSSVDGKTWTTAVASAPWGKRWGHTVLQLYDMLLLFGGRDESSTYYNDVWSSFDGVNWSLMLSAAPWTPRSGQAHVVHGTYVWMLGGKTGTNSFTNEVWRTHDGVSWTKDPLSTPWSPRSNFGCVVKNDKCWILGGQGSGGAMGDIWYIDAKGGLFGNWYRISSAASWTVRSEFGCIVAGSKLWILGGVSNGSILSDVWSSTDGTLWTQETGSAPFLSRMGHAVMFSDDKIWISGGEGGGVYRADVWSLAIPYGCSEVASSSPWGRRQGMAVVSFQGKMWMLGGNAGTTGNSSMTSEVWSSLNGWHWVLENPAAPWAARIGHSCVVYNSKLWILGGLLFTPSGISQYLNDVWSSPDGVNWIQEVQTAPWSARSRFATAVFNNKIWVFGGYDGGGSRNDVWSSGNGVGWVLETGGAAWSPRSQHNSTVFNGKIWIFGEVGVSEPGKNDVWSSPDGVNWNIELATGPWAGATVLTKRRFVGVYMGKMTIYGDESWTSTDGVQWTKGFIDKTYGPDHDIGLAVVYSGRIWLLGGSYGGHAISDVWTVH